MKPTELRMLAVAMLTLGSLGPARPVEATPAASTVDPRITLDWEVKTGRGGRPIIAGYVYNAYGRPASDVHVLVETLDASGTVIARNLGFAIGVVNFNDRLYFEIPVRAPGASYRVSVTSLDWKGAGGGP